MEVKNNELCWAKVRPDAIIPTKEPENAGYDIYANFEQDLMVFAPGETRLVPTGVACAVTEDYYLQVEERGSTGSKGIKKSAGVIDSGYRGEIFIAITNCTSDILLITDYDQHALETYVMDLSQNCEESEKLEKLTGKILSYPKSKAIAQLVVHRVEKMEEKVISYEELLQIPSTRGVGALGSSNK